MNVTAERIPQSQVVLHIEVEPERVERSMDWAFKKLSGRTRIPGFRKGKVPRAMLERYLGREAVLREAIDHLVPEVYREAVLQEDIRPIAQPDIEIEELEPTVRLKAIVPLAPTIDLAGYKDVRVPFTEVTVEDAEVDEALEDMRKRYATLEPVERAVRDGDYVTCDVHAWVGDEQILEELDVQFPVHKGGTVSLPGFSDKLLGLKKGKTHEFTLTAPDDLPEASLAGKTVRYTVDIKIVKEEKLPKLDSGFAKTVGEGFGTLAELRKRLREDILASKQRAADDAYQSAVLSAMAEQAKVEYPQVLVENEIDQIIHSRSGQGDHDKAFETYLQQVGRTAEEVFEELRPEATERLIRSLVLSEVASAEKIQVTDDEVTTQIDAMIGDGPNAAQLRLAFDTENGRDVLRRNLLTTRTLERIAEIGRSAGAKPTTRRKAKAEAAPTEKAAKPAATAKTATKKAATIAKAATKATTPRAKAAARQLK